MSDIDDLLIREYDEFPDRRDSMIPTDKKERAPMLDYMLTSCKNDIDSLSKWEQDFITSIDEQFSEKGTLSDKQAEKLEQIYDKL